MPADVMSSSEAELMSNGFIAAFLGAFDDASFVCANVADDAHSAITVSRIPAKRSRNMEPPCNWFTQKLSPAARVTAPPFAFSHIRRGTPASRREACEFPADIRQHGPLKSSKPH